jgi:hypothetical protein
MKLCIFAGTADQGVFVSEDGANTWIAFNAALGNISITELAISVSLPKILYAGTVYGGVWSRTIIDDIEICECDLNRDGNCDGLDWLLFYPDWGRTNCNVADTETCEGDLNGDGSCDELDWLLFYPDWGRTDCP